MFGLVGQKRVYVAIDWSREASLDEYAQVLLASFEPLLLCKQFDCSPRGVRGNVIFFNFHN